MTIPDQILKQAELGFHWIPSGVQAKTGRKTSLESLVELRKELLPYIEKSPISSTLKTIEFLVENYVSNSF